MSAAPSLATAPSALSAGSLYPRVQIGEDVTIPGDVVDLESFCRWAVSDQYPQRGQFSYLHGVIWVDLTMEEMYTHNRVKAEFTRVLGNLTLDLKTGTFLADRMLLRNASADLSTEPDGMYVSYQALQSGTIVRRGGVSPGTFQLEGSPEMVLEIVSGSSVSKDTKDLPELYWRAGVLEYWLIDVRGGAVRFDILKHAANGYQPSRRQAGGWVKSGVFGRSFQLTQQTDPLGDPLFQLAVR